ncbi:hypothetical protein Taro_040439, partial [Colocasia esculenta]|nr:hypothetical protein [Colocasia esculenta]
MTAGELPTRGGASERGKRRDGVVSVFFIPLLGSCPTDPVTCEAHPFFFQVEWQLDLSFVAARLRGVLMLFVQVKESRRILIPHLVPVSAAVESAPRHQQSKGSVLKCSTSASSILRHRQ